MLGSSGMKLTLREISLNKSQHCVSWLMIVIFQRRNCHARPFAGDNAHETTVSEEAG